MVIRYIYVLYIGFSANISNWVFRYSSISARSDQEKNCTCVIVIFREKLNKSYNLGKYIFLGQQLFQSMCALFCKHFCSGNKSILLEFEPNSSKVRVFVLWYDMIYHIIPNFASLKRAKNNFCQLHFSQ